MGGLERTFSNPNPILALLWTALESLVKNFFPVVSYPPFGIFEAFLVAYIVVILEPSNLLRETGKVDTDSKD